MTIIDNNNIKMDNIINKYFELSTSQLSKMEQMFDTYHFWNNRVNLISRKDFQFFYERHVLHSLSICKYFDFHDSTKIMDLGTGGGFPGLPLAIMFPNVTFVLVDSINKKTNALTEIVKEIGLSNIIILNQRAESVNDRFDFIISRAVAKLTQIEMWTNGKFLPNHKHSFKNGLICLKGGDLAEEINNKQVTIYPISEIFEEEFFLEKKIIYIESKS